MWACSNCYVAANTEQPSHQRTIFTAEQLLCLIFASFTHNHICCGEIGPQTIDYHDNLNTWSANTTPDKGIVLDIKHTLYTVFSPQVPLKISKQPLA